LSGIRNYIKGYKVAFAEKANMHNINSLGGVVNTAFKHLYTWLIIFNTILIAIIGISMKIKYEGLNAVLNMRKTGQQTMQEMKLNEELK
jgi:hypothetical protein